MRAVIQRVSEASVKVDDQLISVIKLGFLVLLGVEEDDSEEDVKWLSKKLVSLRIFSDENQNMNLSLEDVKGDILLVSQFTLHAKTKKGNRPSFIKAARPEKAEDLYLKTKNELESLLNKPLQTGEFGAMMKVSLENDGPVTIFIDTKNKE